jgi:Undecaprenyl-phosphate glucose phosphotransferase
MIKKHQRFFNFLLVSLDALTLLLAYVCASIFKFRGTIAFSFDYKYLIGPIWMVSLLLGGYYFMDVYSPMRSRIYRKEVLIIIRAHLVGFVIIYSVQFLNKNLEYSREISLFFAGCALSFILLERYVVRRTLRYLRQIGYNQKHILIVGAGLMGRRFARKVRAHRDLGYNVVGFLDDDTAKHDSLVVGKPILGNYGILPALLEQGCVDEVIIALLCHDYDKQGTIVDACEKWGVRIRIIADYNNIHSISPKIEYFDGIPLLNLRKVPLDDPFNKFAKRLFDIFFSSVAILTAGPAMCCIAIGIKLTSPGPIFFKQERVGLNNRPFNMLKFRTMRVSDSTIAETTWTTADDPRKTKFGSFLRKTSLDELPQFFNVLFGSMSVVGPRPERPHFVVQFKEEIPKYMVKHQVKPGITGWAQVNGWRGDTSIGKRIDCDIYYIENWDPLFDLKIIFLTVFTGLVNKNAY